MQITTELSFTPGAPVSIQGANSHVFFAHDPQLNAELVVKRVEKAKMRNAAEYFAEASLLYDAKHPNVVEVKYACQDAAHIYLAMPKYAGSVQALLKQRFLTAREIVRIGLDFLTGLHHVHTKKLIHFDVKPTNILLDGAGRAALADFGLTRPADLHGLATPSMLYDKQFPPEALTTSTSLTIAADVFQAGFTLYRMCNGLAAVDAQLQALAAPPDAFVQAIKSGTFPTRDFFLPHIPKRLRRLIQQALSVNPDDRFSTVLEMKNELALVDELLDWQFTPDSADGGVWECVDGEHIRRVRLVANGGTWDVLVSRVRTDTGKETQLHAESVRGVQAAKVAPTIYTALKSQ